MAPKRRSLRERDEHAIAGPPPVLPGQTAIDLPGAPEGELVAVVGAPVEVALASTGAPARGRSLRGVGQSARRLGIYFHPADFTVAKAAYLADWQAGGNADTFAGWIAAVLLHHAQLPPAQRADLVRPVRDGGGSTRSFTLPGDVQDAVRAAVIADQGAGRWVSASTWAAVAIHAAVGAARRRGGGTLPRPPARLPNRLTR